MNQPTESTMSRRTTNHHALADFDAAFADINIAPIAAMDATLTDASGDPLTAIATQPQHSLLEHNSATPLVPPV